MKTSVVVPVLNEREVLPGLLASLRECSGVTEIIVSDGGSTDGSPEWCRQQPDIVLINSARGKGPQLNTGAIRATGDIVLFLHADCIVDATAVHAMEHAMRDPQIAGGAFIIRFFQREPRSLRLVEIGINLRARLRRTATGDQGIFVRREVFTAIGGAPDWPLFEDVELVRRIKNAGKFAMVEVPLTISGRRYIRQGVLRTAFLIYALRLGYWLGFSPQRLKHWFKDVRAPGKAHG